MGSSQKIIIDWPLTPMTGWGSYGIQLTQRLFELGTQPLLGCINERSMHCDIHWVALLEHIEQNSASLRAAVEENSNQVLPTDADLLFHPLGNVAPPARFDARKKVGVTFFETSRLPDQTLLNMEMLDLIVTGSSWNLAMLKEQGIKQAELVFQGVDTSRFNPIPVPRLLDRSLVIFAGGKLEARKGQDIVIAAFKELLRFHKDALLIAAWSNLGDVALDGLADCPNVVGSPERGRRESIETWLGENDVPLENVFCLPALVNSQFPNLIKQADVGVFVSRCEGGTNLMAMETLACGVPTILSANTGHLDLLELDMAHAISVGAKGLGKVPVEITLPYGGDPEGLWGETDPQELLECWLRIAAERAHWKEVGRNSADPMKRMSWQQSMESLFSVLEQRSLLDLVR